ncbi:MAG: hypothetical protein JSW51_07055, partial [Gemmatimonadota bacterium]
MRGLVAVLPSRGGSVTVTGLPGSAGAVLVAALCEDHPQRTFLVAAPSPSDAERWHSDLAVLLGDAVRLYPQRESLGEEEPHFEIAGERVETINALLASQARVLVTTLPATAELTRMAHALASVRLDVSKGERRDMSSFIDTLEQMGYERRPSVLDVAQFAVRGGIIDVYGFGMAEPARVEWWGDEIVSIRGFDLDNQRSGGETDLVSILPVTPVASSAVEAGSGGEAGEAGEGDRGTRRSLLDLLPPDTLIISDPETDPDLVRRVWDEAEHHLKVARRRGEDVPGREDVFIAPEAWAVKWSAFAHMQVTDNAPGHEAAAAAPPVADVVFKLQPPPEINRDMKALA